MGSEDRRDHERLTKVARITCQEVTYPLGLRPEAAVEMLDVSEGGVKLQSGQAFEPGTLLQVALVLQGWQRHTTGFLRHGEDDYSKPLTAVGRVVRCVPAADGAYDLGIQFLDIWDDHWRAMRIYLRKQIESRPTTRQG